MATIECNECRKILILGGRLDGTIFYDNSRHFLAHAFQHSTPSLRTMDITSMEIDKIKCDVCKKIVNKYHHAKQDMSSMIFAILDRHARNEHDDNYMEHIKDAVIETMHHYSEQYQLAVLNSTESELQNRIKFAGYN